MLRFCVVLFVLATAGLCSVGGSFAQAADKPAKKAANKAVDKAAKKKALHDRTVAASFKLADKNGDEKLSLDEYKASQWSLTNPEAAFKKLDKNNDGSLSLAEYEAGWPKKEAAGGNKGGKKGGKKKR